MSENVMIKAVLLTDDVVPGKHYVAIPGAGKSWVDKDAVFRRDDSVKTIVDHLLADRRLTLDEAAMAPPDKPIQPHAFVGRSDRWCEVCDRPDRNPIHIKEILDKEQT